MSLEFKKKSARLTGILTVEEAETLLEWLQANPKGKLDLAGCTHLHAAHLQVLMAARPQIAAWPHDLGLAGWLKHALNSH